jgi:peptidoglycan/LPS O-acetylase OafA/YrhL
MLFFVLSGFVIAEAAHAVYGGRPGAFLLNRLLRILPPFAAAIAVTWTVQCALFAAGMLHPLEGEAVGAGDLAPCALVANLLAILPGAHLLKTLPGYPLIRYVWAIRVELMFYLVVAGGLAASLAVSARRRDVAFILGCAGGVACCAALLAMAFDWPLGALRSAPYFTLGGALFHQARKHAGSGSIPWLIATGAGVGIVADVCSQTDGTWIAFQASSIVLSCASIALLAVANLPPRWARFDRWIGGLSYPVYLNHFLAGTVVMSLGIGRGPISLALASLVALVLAAVMERIVEPPLERLRTRVRKRALVSALYAGT